MGCCGVRGGAPRDVQGEAVMSCARWVVTGVPDGAPVRMRGGASQSVPDGRQCACAVGRHRACTRLPPCRPVHGSRCAADKSPSRGTPQVRPCRLWPSSLLGKPPGRTFVLHASAWSSTFMAWPHTPSRGAHLVLHTSAWPSALWLACAHRAAGRTLASARRAAPHVHAAGVCSPRSAKFRLASGGRGRFSRVDTSRRLD